MGDIILLTYGHDHKHKQFIKYWREFRKRHRSKNTPELARRNYNLVLMTTKRHLFSKKN